MDGDRDMARPAAEQPTELELQILKILWRKSPQLVRDIRDELAKLGRDIAHTSVITTLNTMVKKRIVIRKKEGNAFLFSPRITREQVSRSVLGDIVNRVFDGSAKAVLLGVFEQNDIDRGELKELRKLIDQRIKGTDK
jgi:BlaI family transcriptional regulator, penicillinase repressor